MQNQGEYADYENKPMAEIHRAQRTLDEMEFKLKSYKKEKTSMKKLQTKNDLPNFKDYLAYLISENEAELEEQQMRKEFSMTKFRRKNKESMQNRKTQKEEEEFIPMQFEENFNLKKHTQSQLQLEKSNLDKIQLYYRQNCDLLDEKIRELETTRQKIKKDKVLLMRDNEELQRKIQQKRKQKQNSNNENNPQHEIVMEMSNIILELRKKLAKIQGQNNQIRKRKKELQGNMRNCLKNNQEMIRSDMNLKKSKTMKSKSLFMKCPYH